MNSDADAIVPALAREMISRFGKTFCWYLTDLSKAQGKQELFTHQSSQKLKILREHALVESAISFYRVFHGELESICIA